MHKPLLPPFAIDKLPIKYSHTDLQLLFEYHRQIARCYHVNAPYFEYTSHQSESCPFIIYEDEYLHGVRLRGGNIKAFNSLEMAAVIHEQTSVYITKGAFGNSFPKEDYNATEALLAFMMDGFDTHTVYVLFDFYEQGCYKPISAAKVTFGCSQRTVRELNGNPSTTLSTFASLIVPTENIDAYPDFAETCEWELVCMTRLFRQPYVLLNDLEVNNGIYFDVTSDVFAYLGIAYTAYAMQTGRHIKYAVVDTTIDRVKRYFKREFGAYTIGDGDVVRPTQAILESPVSYHYQEFSGKIQYLAIPTSTYISGIARLGYPIPISI